MNFVDTSELEEAHTFLDSLGISRVSDIYTVSLKERIKMALGQQARDIAEVSASELGRAAVVIYMPPASASRYNVSVLVSNDTGDTGED